MNGWSLRSRLRLGTFAAIVAVMAISSLIVYALINRSLYHEFDATLRTQTQLLAHLVDRQQDFITVDYDAAKFPEYASDVNPDYFCYRSDDDEVLSASPSLIESGRSLPLETGPITAPVIQNLILPDGRKGRCAGIYFKPRSSTVFNDTNVDSPLAHSYPQVKLVVARATTEIESDLSQLALVLLIFCSIAIISTLCIIEFMVRVLLRPVDHVATRIAEYDIHDLSTPWSVKEVPRELVPMVTRLSELLSRLDIVMQRERAFSSDVAHELRTPFAGLRATIEATLARPRDTPHYLTALHECLSICTQTEGVINTLLILSRSDHDHIAITRSACDFDLLLKECWKLVAAEAEKRHLHITWILTPCVAHIDQGLIRLVLTNIYTNAVTYVNDGGTITISTHQDQHATIMTISNSGCSLNPDLAARVFDRFWRGDQARTGTGTHSGLGLALCHVLVTLHGGSIRADIVAEQFTLTITLPL